MIALSFGLGGCKTLFGGAEPVGTVAQMCETLPPVSISKDDRLTVGTKTIIAKDTVAKRGWCGAVTVAREKPKAATPTS